MKDLETKEETLKERGDGSTDMYILLNVAAPLHLFNSHPQNSYREGHVRKFMESDAT